MRLITQVDLTFKSNVQLQLMINEYAALLYTMDASTYEYYIVRDSLTIMQRALKARQMKGPGF